MCSSVHQGGTVSSHDLQLPAVEPEPFVYEPLVLDLCGPPLPDADHLSSAR